ncbi:hypothetical protein BK133_29395 [Paenibacillus sp. FSL H8-0548]|uniref:ATP-binding cassette domain-containing protein n=1 Tax=Paenibacillus sp. FSL H8-0548 TaxID=1920422 RepID=UPI00096BF09B|nr:ATP-binding cassette domain-containing protein [Paenibacillus sp. FSL H8-0548]OMF20294.1 hypothetical protein BK133_29395 [Paenibacillus sp. FSL H8-0548]
MNPLLEVESVTKYYYTSSGLFRSKSKAFAAVEDVNLIIERGEIVGLIGESGSGKSTLGRLISRLADPTSGRIRFDGHDITKLDHRSMMPFYRRMQVIFQDNTSSLNPRRTIGDQIVAPMLRLGAAHNRKEAEAAAINLLERVGLKPEFFHRYPHEFSGGQRQRIGIARALAVKAEFLILDEPTSALDVSIQAQILNLLLDLREEFGLTYLFIGHNLAVIEFFCDRVIVMEKGRIVESLAAERLFQDAQHTVTRSLLDSVLTLNGTADL